MLITTVQRPTHLPNQVFTLFKHVCLCVCVVWYMCASVCVSTYMCVCVSVHVRVRAQVDVSTHMPTWRPEVSVRHFPLATLTLMLGGSFYLYLTFYF